MSASPFQVLPRPALLAHRTLIAKNCPAPVCGSVRCSQRCAATNAERQARQTGGQRARARQDPGSPTPGRESLRNRERAPSPRLPATCGDRPKGRGRSPTHTPQARRRPSTAAALTNSMVSSPICIA